LNIILVSNTMAKAKTLTLWHIVGLLLAVIFLSVVITLLLIVPHGGDTQQGVKRLLSSPLNLGAHFPQKHLDAMAIQLGEIQARVMQLDAQSRRLSKLAGEKGEKIELNTSKQALPAPNTGGPQVNARPFTKESLQQQIDILSRELDEKTTYLSELEVKLIDKSMERSMIPDYTPLDGAYNSSSFGWRVDPFTGHSAFHEGLDFTANTGTPIYAAAGGVVTTAEHTSAYGKLVKIDHGDGFETRYAHASKIMVKVGEVVKKGQVLALVGSTGRSTGPHLHFEVRRAGAPLDPRKFLASQ
jgi:murein DD-endopeptidase MepM/ murein hydrolase activator NlpD